MSVDLLEVVKACVAIILIAITVGVVGLIFGVAWQAIKGKGNS